MELPLNGENCERNKVEAKKSEAWFGSVKFEGLLDIQVLTWAMSPLHGWGLG